MDNSQRGIELKSTRELFLDRFLIDQMNGTTLTLNVKAPQPFSLDERVYFNGFAARTEKDYGYATLIAEDRRLRLYYRGFCEGASGKPDETLCYAESHDGINFLKPNLNRCEVGESKENNVIRTGIEYYSHNFSPMLDRNPRAAHACRYKALAGHKRSGGLKAFGSEDGIEWFALADESVLTVPDWSQHGFDSQNVSFWSDVEGCYVAYCRTWKLGVDQVGMDIPAYGVRWISRSTSADFIHWTELEELVPDNGIYEHLYTNQLAPYFRCPQLYIGLGTRFVPHGGPGTNNTTDICLFTSRGHGATMNRTFMESFIRPGLNPCSWTNRAMYTTLNIVPINSAQMAIYLKNMHHTQMRLLYRTDGLASLHAGYAGGDMVTKPFTFEGDALDVNYATSAVGQIRIALLAEDGGELPGLGIEDVTPLYGDLISHTVQWKPGADVGALQGRRVRLRFVMKDADVYSFRFFSAPAGSGAGDNAPEQSPGRVVA